MLLSMVQRAPYAVARKPCSNDLLTNENFVSDVENCLEAELLCFLLICSSRQISFFNLTRALIGQLSVFVPYMSSDWPLELITFCL